MKWVFWISAGLLAYTYLGYPAWLWLRGRLRSQPVKCASCEPPLSVVMVVRNEAEGLKSKLQNLKDLDYPEERWEIVIVSDGSTDGTGEILERAADARIRVKVNPTGRGKAACLNDAMEIVQGQIIVFTDVRQRIEPNALRLLLENFADAAVGCVSGELMLGDPRSGESIEGIGLYWDIEKKIRELESASGSVVGATGALYGVRRDLVPVLPEGTILDDVYIPMHAARHGARVLFESRARAWDTSAPGGREFARKVRTLSGNYELLQQASWLLSRENPIRFEFISHKLLRLLTPFALAATLVSSALLPQPVYRIALLAQLLFYCLSILAMAGLKRGALARAADAAWTFVLLNTAAVVAFANFVTGRKAAWSR